jgi:hypothetical protein
MGIESPKAISEYLRGQGVPITPEHVSTIKGNLKRKGELIPKRRRGRRPKQESAAGGQVAQAGEQVAQPAARTTAAPSVSGLTPQDLTSLGELAGRAGGIEKLQEFLNALNRIR